MAAATPVHHLVSGSMATDGDKVGWAPLVAQTHAVVVVVLARQPPLGICPQGMGQKVWGPRVETRVTAGLVQGGRVKLVTEI